MANPKMVLDALLAGDGEQLGYSAEDLSRARALVSAPEAAGIEHLPEPLALAVLEASVQRKIPAVAEALSTSPRRELAKMAKKALYRLKSSGVAVEARRSKGAATPTSAPAFEPEEEFPALVSAVTGSGDRALIVVRPLRGGGLETIQAVINDENGVMHLVLNEVSRATWRRQLKQLRSGDAPPSIELPTRDAAALLAHAAALNLESRAGYPRGTEEALRHFGVTAQRRAPEIPEPDPGDQRLVTEGHLLHEEEEIATWLPPEAELRALGQKLHELDHSPLQLTDAQRAEQLTQAFRGAAQAFFTPAMKRLYAVRLWAMAEFFERTGRAHPAMVARAEARRLFHDAPGLFSRFAEFLFEKVLHLSRRGAPPRAEPTAPAQRAPDAQPGERTSPGGIILP